MPIVVKWRERKEIAQIAKALPYGVYAHQTIRALPKSYIEMLTVDESNEEVILYDSENNDIYLPADPIMQRVFEDLNWILQQEMCGDFSHTMGIGLFVVGPGDPASSPTWEHDQMSDAEKRAGATFGCVRGADGKTRYTIRHDPSIPGHDQTHFPGLDWLINSTSTEHGLQTRAEADAWIIQRALDAIRDKLNKDIVRAMGIPKDMLDDEK